MEQHAQATQSAMEFTSTCQTAYTAPTYLPAAAVAEALTNGTIPPPFPVPPPHPLSAPTYRPAAAVTGAPTNGTIPPPFPVPPPHPFAYLQVPQFYHPQQQLLQEFWSNQMQEIEQTTDYKNHSLPLARIKKIMKADEDVRMISSEAPVVIAKACEIFILELMLRSWIHTEENKRRTLQKNDIAGAISRTDMFDFLVDIVPRDEVKDEGAGIPRAVGPGDQMPYYYMPAHADPAAVATMAGAYGVQDPRLMAYMLQQAQVQVTPEASAMAGAYGVQDPRLMAYMLQQAQAQAQVQVTPEASATAGAYGVQDPCLMAYMLQQAQGQVTPEASADHQAQVQVTPEASADA